MNWPRFDLDAFRADPDVSAKVYSRIENALPGVVLLGLRDGRVIAHVKGNDAPWYVTTAYNDGGDQRGSCTCPHYMGNQLCKHIGAVMMACNERPFVTPTPLDLIESELSSIPQAQLVDRLIDLAISHPSFLAVLEGRSPDEEDEEDLSDD